MSESVFRTAGRWLRGNLHTHTANSDGQLPLAEAVAKYREAGYDFLAVTDHRITSDTAEFATDTFLTIPSIELNARDPETDALYHVVGVGVKPFAQEDREVMGNAQVLIDKVREAGGMPILAHPYWSGNDVADLASLQGLAVMEVYNATCARHGKERGEMHWDALLERGLRLWGVAVDDTHRYETDAAKAWVMVKAPELSIPSILTAVQAGQFYATTGPAILDIAQDDRDIWVHCSPVQQVRFIGRRGSGRSVAAGYGEVLTSARVRKPKSPYIRVEVIDATGKTAWSQPIFMGE